MPEHLLLTGAVGLLGRYLLRDLLLEGVPLAVLIRSQKEQSAPARLQSVLAYWEEQLGRPLPRPICLEGDLTVPGLGLTDEGRRWIAQHCRGVIHNAASLTFTGSDRAQEPWLTNVTGTDHLLAVCRELNLHELHYVSTAYVCGLRPGPVAETELECGQKFRNDYEDSKYETELRVRAASFLRRLTVYRPAIIVGDSRTGYTSTYHGLYSYLQFVWMLSQYATRNANGRWLADVRLNITGDEPRNLVPVDWVSAVMTHILVHPEWHGRTYHLAPRRPVTARALEAAMSEVFAYYGPTFVGPEGLARGDLNEIEKAFYDYVNRYAPYWAQEPVFDCTNTDTAAPALPCPDLDHSMLRRLTEFAIQDQWGKRTGRRAPRRRAVPVGD
jgi:nucleoside-diphosphate-sugar epimerase